eukprot:9696045-Alexandrium_andersonii.AAC.1
MLRRQRGASAVPFARPASSSATPPPELQCILRRVLHVASQQSSATWTLKSTPHMWPAERRAPAHGRSRALWRPPRHAGALCCGPRAPSPRGEWTVARPVSYTHLRAHETSAHL